MIKSMYIMRFDLYKSPYHSLIYCDQSRLVYQPRSSPLMASIIRREER